VSNAASVGFGPSVNSRYICIGDFYEPSTSLLQGDLTFLTHGLFAKSFGSRTQETSPTLLSDRLSSSFPPYPRETAPLFGYVARVDPKQDHHRVSGASLRPPGHCRIPCGRPRTSWLRAIDTDIQSVNIGIHSAWRKASDRTLWRRIVDTATLHHGARH